MTDNLLHESNELLNLQPTCMAGAVLRGRAISRTPVT